MCGILSSAYQQPLEEALDQRSLHLRLAVDNTRPSPVATILRRISPDPANVHAPHGIWLSEPPTLQAFVRQIRLMRVLGDVSIVYHHDPRGGHHWLFFSDHVTPEVLRQMLGDMGYITEIQTIECNFLPRGMKELESLLLH